MLCKLIFNYGKIHLTQNTPLMILNVHLVCVIFTFFLDGSQNFFILENWKSIRIKQTNNSPLLLPPRPGNHCSAFSFYESVVFFFGNGNIHYFKLLDWLMIYSIMSPSAVLHSGLVFAYIMRISPTISLASTCLHTKLFQYYWPYSWCCIASLWLLCNWCFAPLNPIHLFWTLLSPFASSNHPFGLYSVEPGFGFVCLAFRFCTCGSSGICLSLSQLLHLA